MLDLLRKALTWPSTGCGRAFCWFTPPVLCGAVNLKLWFLLPPWMLQANCLLVVPLLVGTISLDWGLGVKHFFLDSCAFFSVHSLLMYPVLSQEKHVLWPFLDLSKDVGTFFDSSCRLSSLSLNFLLRNFSWEKLSVPMNFADSCTEEPPYTNILRSFLASVLFR